MEKHFFPLSVVTRRISELLQPAISKQFWVKAEISSGNERNGNFYCELVETDAGKITAKLECKIWKNELVRIRESFRSQDMDLVLSNGTKVGFFCSLQYKPQFGLYLQVIDADPAFAMGEMELKKREIIERLKREGLFEPNKERVVPLLPLRIGLITSRDSAAYNDFIQTLTASRYGFKVYLADAMMQGDQTERTVLRGLERLRKLGVELIVIARGGGSKTDLYSLDNEAIARKIADCTIPVWTGIGHEIDTSVLDHVANKAFKTPTAVAEDLVARFVQMRRQLDEASNTLKTVWTFNLERDRAYLDRATTGIRQGSRKLLDVTGSNLRERAQTLRFQVSGRISNEQVSRKAKEQSLRSKPVVLLQFSRERLTSKGRLLGSRVRSEVSRARSSFNVMEQRFDRGRFLRRVQVDRDSIGRKAGQMKSRFLGILKVKETQLSRLRAQFRLEKIRPRLVVEQRSLSEKLATLNASSPDRAIERGFTLTYRQDGRLVRSVKDVLQADKIRTHLSDGIVVSEVICKEDKP
ncbi:MAG: exodeoxyribonuclease VII large subunit [Deltaproteobacteria bacterium]|nr:MAG: exodeoxyribonuclease VII large subunit [Deltaproteobacteria bacterium]